MLAENVPYQIIGGLRFFERAEIKDALGYLRVVDNPRSDVDILRIINVPPRKIGDATIERLVQAADERGSSLFEALGPAAEGGAMGAAAKNAVLRFRDLLQELMKLAKDLGPSELCEQVLERSGYNQMLRNDDRVEAETRAQNLREFVGSILAYEEDAAAGGEEATLSGYLERISLQSDADTLEDVPKVAMMTVHAAKGLEFDTVFLTGMEEELFPFRSLEPKRGDDQEEERRLAYVAVTRARRKLWITHAGRRTIFGNTRYGLASRFIGDMPRAAVRQEMTASMASGRTARTPYGMDTGSARPRAPWQHPQERASVAMRPGSAEPARAPGERYVERDTDSGGGEGAFRVGARVEHKTFGMGVVQGSSGGDDATVTVKFSGYTPKSIKAKFLRLVG
jgi:DNA helicase-2/ATP-dependent DNA helicase PcrA